jgi:hypothetical protein
VLTRSSVSPPSGFAILLRHPAAKHVAGGTCPTGRAGDYGTDSPALAEIRLALSGVIAYDAHHMQRAAAGSKEVTHERIVEAAARAIRRSGYNGTGVADIMKDAGLTHGGFYAHFGSREAMLAEAADRAGSESVALMERIAAAVPPEQAARLPRSVRRCRARRQRCGASPRGASRK